MKKLYIVAFGLFFLNCTKKEKNPQPEENSKIELQMAVFAEGCYWCTEYVFESIPGVEEVVSGYSGGNKDNRDYNKVVEGEPRHAEGVQIYYDESQVSFEELVTVFFDSHDPTTINQQGPDKGEEYRSIAFYSTKDEKESIERKIKQLTEENSFPNTIITEVKPFELFLPVKEQQQDYIKKNPNDPYVLEESIPRYNRFVAKYKGKLKKAHH